MSLGVLQRLTCHLSSRHVGHATRRVTSTSVRITRNMVARAQAADPPGEPMERRTLRGVIFDMDGTLTVPNHDFAEMYRRVGCKTRDILTEIESWPETERKRANDIIHEMETEALATMKAMPGAEKLGAFLDSKGLPRGLVTRNVQASVAHFHANAWTLPPFAPALAREFKPYKPAPDALLHICAQWNLPPNQVVMIGDSAKDDVVSGNRAGCVTVLLDTEGKWRIGGEEGDGGTDGTEEGDTEDNGLTVTNALTGEMVPHFIVNSLDEVAPTLRAHFDLAAPDNKVPEPASA